MNRLRVPIAILAALAFGMSPVQAHAQTPDQTSIITAWVRALDAYDFDAAVALLDDESFVTFLFPQGDTETTYAGKEEIRRALESYKEDHTRIQLVAPPHLENGTVIWIERQSNDSVQRLGLASVDLLGQGLVAGSKIKSILYSLTPEATAIIEKAQSSGSAPVGVGMPTTGAYDALGLSWNYAGLLALAGLSILAGLMLRVTHPRRAGRG